MYSCVNSEGINFSKYGFNKVCAYFFWNLIIEFELSFKSWIPLSRIRIFLMKEFSVLPHPNPPISLLLNHTVF